MKKQPVDKTAVDVLYNKEKYKDWSDVELGMWLNYGLPGREFNKLIKILNCGAVTEIQTLVDAVKEYWSSHNDDDDLHIAVKKMKEEIGL